MTVSTGVLSSVLVAAGLGDVLSLLIRVTLIAAIGVFLCSRLRTASAAKRHLTAMATLVALLTFPVAKGILPVLRLPVLPAAPTSTLLRTDPSSPNELAGTSHVIVPEPGDTGTAEGLGTTTWGGGSARRFSDDLILVWLVVTSALLLRVLISFIAAALAANRARRIDDAELRRELQAACARLGVSRAVDIRETSHFTVPVVWGLLRPVLLLPVGASRWSREQLRVVFLHEAAHVARHDGVGLLLTRVATSVFWFHPLVWTLARIAQRECERCCDDLVLAAGERPTDYAAHLLAIVRSLTRSDRFAGVAPALATRSNLEGRLVSILRNGQRRDSISRSRLVATITFATLLLVATTAVQVVAAPEPAPDASDLALEATGDACQESGADAEADAEAVAERAERTADTRLASADALKALEGAAEAGQSYLANLMGLEASTETRSADSGVQESVSPPECPEAVEVAIAPPPMYVVAGSSYKNKNKDKSDDLNQSGIEFMRAGQYAQAITAFEQEIRKSGSTNAMYNLACAHALRGNKRPAFAALENAIENGFDNTHHMTEDEDLKLLQGDPHFYQLVRLAQDLQLYSGSGRFGNGMKDEEDWRRSLSRFERVTKEHPTIGRAWANLGFARLESGDAKGGAAAYQRALDLNYQTPTTLYNLACCASRSGDIDGAFRWLDRSDKAGMEIGQYVGSDSDLDALRGDPRYGAMLERWDQKMAKEHREKQKDEERQKTD